MVFVKTVLLIVIWGLYHGLILLPSLLSALPPTCLEKTFYQMFYQRLSSNNDSGKATSLKFNSIANNDSPSDIELIKPML